MTQARPDVTPTPEGAVAGAPIGPGSLTWRYLGDRRHLLFLGRTGTLQSMHPAVGAALQQHSDFFADPWERLFRSIPLIMGVVYDPSEAGTAARVRDYHKDIKGHDARGRRYHALNPDVYWWTHATFIELIIAINEHFGTPLTLAEKDRLVAEGITWWQRYGLSMRPVVHDYASFQAYWERMLTTELERNATTDYALAIDQHRIPPPPGVPRLLWLLLRKPVMRFNLWLGNALMPEPARRTLGLTWTRRDQRRFRILAALVRRLWPLLPERARYNRRAYRGIRAARRTGVLPARAQDTGQLPDEHGRHAA